jgi:hypothetical protein
MFETKNGSNKIGLGGWLSFWLILTCLWFLRAIFHIDIHLLSNETTQNFTTLGSAEYHPLCKPLFILEFITQFFLPSYLITLLVFYSLKSRFFPRLAIFFYLINFILILIDHLGFYLINRTILINEAIVLPIPPHFYNNLVGSLICVCVWIPYFLKSKRVKATFVK